MSNKILTFCNLLPRKLTKKSHIKIEWCQPLSSEKNKILDKTKDKPVVFLCSICLTWSLITPKPPKYPSQTPNPITLWTKSKHRILLLIYEKEIRIVKLNEMCVEETKSQNEKETFIMILTENRKIEKQNSSLWTFEIIDHYNIIIKSRKETPSNFDMNFAQFMICSQKLIYFDSLWETNLVTHCRKILWIDNEIEKKERN